VSSNASDVAPENRPTPGTPQAEPPAAHDQANDRLSRARWWLGLAGLVAGLVAFGIGEMIYELIPAKKVAIPTMGQIVIAPSVETSNVAATRNGALTFGVLGVCLGGFLGIAGGLARRSASASVVAGLLGSILGLALAAGACFALLPFFLKTLPNHPDYDLLLSMIMHGSIWGLTGAAAGLAFAVGLGGRRLLGRALAAGFAGAVLGAIAFDLIGGLLFSLANTGQPISTTWPTRLMARLMVTVTTATVVILLLPGSRPDKAPRQPVITPTQS
jgi:uncharacterized membrane protein